MRATFEARKIKSVDRLNSCTHWITLEGSLKAVPGQFVMVWLPESGEKPFSIASMDPFGLIVVDVGPFSHIMHSLKKGDSIWIKGPLGHGFHLEGEHLLLVAGGYGVAPLYPLAVVARAQERRIHACIGAGTETGVLLADGFAALGCSLSVTTEDGSQGMQGLATMAAEKAMRELNFDSLYACGPNGMLSVLAEICRQRKINYQFSWEAHMRCGMGLCGSCEVPTSLDRAIPPGWLACYDGPVFIKKWENE